MVEIIKEQALHYGLPELEVTGLDNAKLNVNQLTCVKSARQLPT